MLRKYKITYVAPGNRQRELTMNENKQIVEIKECIDAVYGADCAYFDVDGFAIANEIYKKGFCKALEVIGEIEKIIDKHYNRHIFGVEELSDVEQEAVMNFSDDVTYDIAELKKKYTESEKDNGTDGISS